MRTRSIANPGVYRIVAITSDSYSEKGGSKPPRPTQPKLIWQSRCLPSIRQRVRVPSADQSAARQASRDSFRGKARASKPRSPSRHVVVVQRQNPSLPWRGREFDSPSPHGAASSADAIAHGRGDAPPAMPDSSSGKTRPSYRCDRCSIHRSGSCPTSTVAAHLLGMEAVRCSIHRWGSVD